MSRFGLISKWAVAVISILGILPAHAEDARVLPAGRSRFSATYGRTNSISDAFNSSGQRETILSRYGADRLDLSSENLKTLDSRVKELITALNGMGHYNAAQRGNHYYGLTKDPSDPLLGDALSLGTITASGEAERSMAVFSYQHGLTDQLSVGFMIPIVHNKVTVHSNFGGDRTVDDVYKIVQSNDVTFQDHQRALDLLRTINTETLQQILEARGYERFENYEGGGLGDVVVGGRFNYLNRRMGSGEWVNSFQSFLTLPTGTTRPPSALTRLGTGSGTVDLGTAHIMNYSPVRFFTLSNGLYYTYRFANHSPTRVRSDPSDILPDASSEELLSQKLANKYWTNLGAKFRLLDFLSFETSYEWFWKGRDQYQGSRTDRDYTYLSETSDSSPSYSETLQMGVSLSSIPAFLRSEFPAPADISVNFYLPCRGKNAIITPYGTAELALYF